MPWQTHEVTNQVPELHGYNLLANDTALLEGLRRGRAGWHEAELMRFGDELGTREVLALGDLVNRHPPELSTHDRFGHRIDRVEFHPGWHSLLGMLRCESLHALPWIHPRPGAHVARAVGYFMQSQVESGSLCPTTMTFAAIPVLQREPVLFAGLRRKLYAREHDPRDLPLDQKKSILVGMGMTEKQGGSDVRSNTSSARPLGGGGRGAMYAITGHKWFLSAPMCDAHLVLARTEAGLSCFWMPRWRADGSKNAVLVQRLKDKLGNRSNASSEVEFHDAEGVMIGDEGRGVPTIIEMANHTRLDCVIGSAGLMRQCFVQAAHHATHRHAFGRRLLEQPLMHNVLCDLALESEAATLLMLRLAAASDLPEDPLQRAWRRVVTPAAKFWICKRSLAFTGECMEVWGGNGYVETGPLARMYREAPVNSIWEGSGNVMCLDVLRAIERAPDGFPMLLDELQAAARGHPGLEALGHGLRHDLSLPPAEREASGRRIAQKLVLAAQGCLMLQHAPEAVAHAFIASRCDAEGGRVHGTLAGSAVGRHILRRAWPPAG